MLIGLLWVEIYCICIITWPNLAEGSYEFLAGSFCWYVTILTSLLTVGIVLNLSRDPRRPHVQSVIQTFGWNRFSVSHYLAMLGSYWFSANIKYLISLTTSQIYVIEGSSNLMSENFSLYLTNLSSLVARSIMVVEKKHVQSVTLSRQNTSLKDHVTLWVGVSDKSTYFKVLWS